MVLSRAAADIGIDVKSERASERKREKLETSWQKIPKTTSEF
jgi:hypothetical protein